MQLTDTVNLQSCPSKSPTQIRHRQRTDKLEPSTPDVGCREAGGRDQGTEERGWSGLAEQDCDLKQTFRASQRLTEGPVHRGSLCTHKIISRHFMESSDLDDSTLYEERTRAHREQTS